MWRCPPDPRRGEGRPPLSSSEMPSGQARFDDPNFPSSGSFTSRPRDGLREHGAVDGYDNALREVCQEPVGSIEH